MPAGSDPPDVKSNITAAPVGNGCPVCVTTAGDAAVTVTDALMCHPFTINRLPYDAGVVLFCRKVYVFAFAVIVSKFVGYKIPSHTSLIVDILPPRNLFMGF